jgi:hypothetical protein
MIVYMVYVKAAAHSPWRYTGVVESNKETAEKIWPDIIKRLRYHAYRLEYCTNRICIERSLPCGKKLVTS